jgi:RNA polymerase sigma-70 factor (ECF subfamily)
MGHVPSHAEAPVNDQHERRIENRDEVERLLAGLPSQEAEIVRRFHLHGSTYREISRELGVPENTIGPTLSRARQRLRDRSTRHAQRPVESA